jgi:hypothetical protein
MRKFFNNLNQKFGRIMGIYFDQSETFDDNPEFRWQIIKSIWDEDYNVEDNS